MTKSSEMRSRTPDDRSALHHALGITKTPLGTFLAANPYPGKLTDGLFFRDKMRSIHRVAPDHVGPDLLEIGGGQSGLSKLLYPEAQVVNLDFDPSLAEAPCNVQPGVRFVVGDATDLPFGENSFDTVTMFDVLEHVEDDRAVACEAFRVLRPGGTVLVTTPNSARWRYPYFAFFRAVCPDETELFARWGHVRRGYNQEDLDALFGGSPIAVGGFINRCLALSHDITFSRLPRPARLLLHAAVAPVSIIGWLSQRPGDPGTEIAAAWRKDF
jgi:SAM-dependent methyltransferase